jgi:hypothetical protein
VPKSLRSCVHALLVFAILAPLVGCAPGAVPGVGAPTFRLVPGGSGIQRLDLTDDGARLVVRTTLRVANPNPVGLRLASLDGALLLRELPAADVRFVGGVDVPPQGAAELVLDVAIPLPGAAGLADAALALVGGAPVAFRIEAAVGVDLFGVRTAFPRATLLQGELQGPPLAAVAPRLRWVPEAAGIVGLRAGRIVVGLAFDVENPGVLSYRASVPDAALRIDGREVARVRVAELVVPAGSSVRWVQEVAIDPLALGAGLSARLASGALVAPVEVALAGGWSLDLGPLGRVALPAATLGSGPLD